MGIIESCCVNSDNRKETKNNLKPKQRSDKTQKDDSK